MCGIVGKFSAHDRRDPGAFARMCDLIAHRGPDDRGTYFDGPVGLGQTRLSILDLSPAGHQPMSSADGRYWIVFNGEIYNFMEIRDQLQKRGYSFKSRSDTEVLVNAYAEWGADCLNRLNGMFAFAIWDCRDQSLFLARDQIGVKPLYYYFDGKRFLFASEIKALLADPAVAADISPTGLRNYLTFGHGIAPETIFSGVKKVPPAHMIKCSMGTTANEIKIEVSRYWSLPLPGQESDRGERHYIEGTRSHLTEAVRRQKIADVPVGVFLSGGLDSSIMTGLMSREVSEPLHTFSVGFETDAAGYSETEDARRVAAHFKTVHHEVVLRADDLLNSVGFVAYQYDEPYADAANVPTYLLAKLAREHVKVALSGEGSDEIFGGYRRYVAEQTVERMAFFNSLMSSRLARKTLSLARGSGRISRLMRGIGMTDDVERYVGWMRTFSDTQQYSLLTADWQRAISPIDAGGAYRAAWPVGVQGGANRAMYLDQAIWLPDTYLEKADKATMAAGLEARVPFLDLEVVKFAATIPSRYKVHGRQTKYILKKAMTDLLPAETLRKRKHGFAVPYAEWFRGPLREYIRDVLLSDKSRVRGIIDRKAVEKILEQHDMRRETHYRQLWVLLIFELWSQRYLDTRFSGSSATEQWRPAVVTAGALTGTT